MEKFVFKTARIKYVTMQFLNYTFAQNLQYFPRQNTYLKRNNTSAGIMLIQTNAFLRRPFLLHIGRCFNGIRTIIYSGKRGNVVTFGKFILLGVLGRLLAPENVLKFGPNRGNRREWDAKTGTSISESFRKEGLMKSAASENLLFSFYFNRNER